MAREKRIVIKLILERDKLDNYDCYITIDGSKRFYSQYISTPKGDSPLEWTHWNELGERITNIYFFKS